MQVFIKIVIICGAVYLLFCLGFKFYKGVKEYLQKKKEEKFDH